MSPRGPSPKPTKILEMAGSWRAKARKGEPHPEQGAPSCPAWLDDEAKAEWRRVTPELERTGVIAKIDRSVLAACCQRWADYVRLREELATEGATFTTPQGYVAKNPKATLMNEALDHWLKLSDRLGLSPAARTRVHGTPQEAEGKDEHARFFG